MTINTDHSLDILARAYKDLPDCCLIPGPIATFLMNHMSHRKVALLGAVISSAGLIAMPFAPNLVYMYGFYGVLSGKTSRVVYLHW